MRKTIRSFAIVGIIFIIYVIATFIMPSTENLGEGYVFDSEAQIIYSTNTNISINPYIVDYKYNQQYIIVKQQLPKYNNVIYNEVIYPNNIDSVFYYVINKQKHLMQGPLDATSFENYIRNMKIELFFYSSKDEEDKSK